MNRPRLVVLFGLVLAAAPAMAQTAAPPPQAQVAGADALGRGWTALAAGQTSAAIEIADGLLRTDPKDHNAAALGVAALGAAGQPDKALELYERWLAASGREDVFLLQPVAKATLKELAAGTDLRIKLAALAALAESGDATARAALDEALADADAPIDVEASLARAGDAGALRRLDAQVRSPARDKSAAIDALAQAGARSSTAAIVDALGDPAPPTRMAAANALADFGATDAIPNLRPLLNDADPAVRTAAAVALARLGEPTKDFTLETMAKSPVADFRLAAAAAAADEDTTGQGDWPERVRPLLTDPDPQVRLKAAQLLLEHGRDIAAAREAIDAAIADPSPGSRAQAARVLAALPFPQAVKTSPAALRKMLRDPLPDLRLGAARALLVSPR